MFELTTATKAKMLNVIVLSQKNRQPDDDPGAKMSIEVQLPAAMLSHFAAHLPEFFFEPPRGAGPAQKGLEGVPPASETPNLTDIGLKVSKLLWSHEMTGYTFEIFIGTRRVGSNILIKDSILSSWKLMPKEGGTVIARFFVESGDVSSETFGRLAKLKSRDIDIGLYPPTVDQRSIDDGDDPASKPVQPAPIRKPGAAERAAAAKAGKPPAIPPAPHKGEERPGRSDRGKAQTKQALLKAEAAFRKSGEKDNDVGRAATDAFVDGSKQAQEHNS